MSELSYIDKDGNTIFTSEYYKNRGSCCKSNCLHCPYGTTLKNCGLSFDACDLNLSSDRQALQDIIDENYMPQSDLSSSLLGAAFGNKSVQRPNLQELCSDSSKTWYFALLKGFVCAVIRVDANNEVDKLYLKTHFQSQGIDLPLVQRFFQDRVEA